MTMMKDVVVYQIVFRISKWFYLWCAREIVGREL